MKPENCIFEPNTDIDSVKQIEPEHKFFTILGSHEFIDANKYPRTSAENKNTFAKQITKNQTQKFYIKTGTYGRIYNPMGLFSEGKSDKFVAKIGKKEYDFQEVNFKIFEMYLNFLSTKNIAWLNNAERELI